MGEQHRRVEKGFIPCGLRPAHPTTESVEGGDDVCSPWDSQARRVYDRRTTPWSVFVLERLSFLISRCGRVNDVCTHGWYVHSSKRRPSPSITAFRKARHICTGCSLSAPGAWGVRGGPSESSIVGSACMTVDCIQSAVLDDCAVCSCI